MDLFKTIIPFKKLSSLSRSMYKSLYLIKFLSFFQYILYFNFKVNVLSHFYLEEKNSKSINHFHLPIFFHELIQSTEYDNTFVLLNS